MYRRVICNLVLYRRVICILVLYISKVCILVLYRRVICNRVLYISKVCILVLYRRVSCNLVLYRRLICNLVLYGGKPLNQFNEDDFLYKFLLLTIFFSNYKLISNQKEAFSNVKFPWLLCLYLSMLFNRLILIKIQVESRINCIDKIAYHRIDV